MHCAGGNNGFYTPPSALDLANIYIYGSKSTSVSIWVLESIFTQKKKQTYCINIFTPSEKVYCFTAFARLSHGVSLKPVNAVQVSTTHRSLFFMRNVFSGASLAVCWSSRPLDRSSITRLHGRTGESDQSIVRPVNLQPWCNLVLQLWILIRTFATSAFYLLTATGFFFFVYKSLVLQWLYHSNV